MCECYVCLWVTFVTRECGVSSETYVWVLSVYVGYIFVTRECGVGVEADV